MKILQINPVQPQKTERKVIPYNRFTLQRDVFIKTDNSEISFKGAEQNIFANLLKNPKATELFIGLTSAIVAYTAVAATTTDNNTADIDTQANNNILTNVLNFFKNGFVQKDEQSKTDSTEIDKYKEEIEKLKKETEEYKAKIEELTSKENVQTEEKPSAMSDNADEKPQEENTVKEGNLVFPKKHGRLSKNQEELKAVVETLDLPDALSAKMIMVCQELLKKNSHKIGAAIKDNNDITADFVKELTANRDNNEEIEKIINIYMKKCELVLPEENAAKEEIPQEKLKKVHVSATKLPGPKVVGKIDLGRTKKTKIAPELITRDKDGNITSIFYKKNGTIPEYTADQLDDIFRNFVKIIYNDYKERLKLNPDTEKPKWLHNEPIPEIIRKPNIIAEIKKQKENGNPDGEYEYIVKTNYYDITDAINDDSRYRDLFDIHSAMRLIERYVKFNINGDTAEAADEDVSTQSNKILNKLFEMIEKSYSEGMRIDVYKDKNSGMIGASIILSAKDFDKEAIDIFGTSDIVIGLSERQKGKRYRAVDNGQKESIISTIYPKCP